MIRSLLLLLTSSVVLVYALSSSIAIKTKGNEKIVDQGIKTVEWCYIYGTSVRMRELPSLKGKIVGYFKDGERVKRIGDPCGEGGWEYVERINGTYGYVWYEYCHCSFN